MFCKFLRAPRKAPARRSRLAQAAAGVRAPPWMARELRSLCYLPADVLAPLRQSLPPTHLSKLRAQVSSPVPSGARPRHLGIARVPALNHAPHRPHDQRLISPHPFIQIVRRLQNTQTSLYPPPPPLPPTPPPPPLPPRPLHHVSGDPSQLITHHHHQSRGGAVPTACRCYRR